MSATVSELATGKLAARWEGEEHGSSVSFFVTDFPPGVGPGAHFHPYDETFIILDGEATFTIGDNGPIVATAGQVLVVPAGVVHDFVGSGEGRCRSVNIHAAPRMEQTWIDQA